MARIRSVKPEMRKSLTVCSWPIPVRWTFVGLLGYLDDAGRGLDELRLLKAELYPLDDDMTAKKIGAHLAVLIDRGPLCRYVLDGQSYLHITSWTEHQRVSHPTPSRIPPCPIHDKPGESSGSAPEDSRTAPEDSGDAPPSRARGAGKGREQGEELAPDGAIPESPGRPRDELFEAIVAVCQLDLASLTKSARGEVNNARRQLAEVDATPGQVQVRANRYRQRYRDSHLTPSALAKHWASLAVTSTAEQRARDPLASAK